MKFVPNPRFFAELDDEPGVRSHLRDRAQEAAAAAETIGHGLGGTGAYAASIESIGPRVLSTDPVAHIIEWGSVNNPPYAPLRRAVESVGADFVDDV